MKDKSDLHPFDSTKQYCFPIYHPPLPETDQSLVEFTAESTYPRAIKAGIAMIKEFELPWTRLSNGDWSRTIDRDALWLTNSGKLISRCHSTFREGKHESQLLIDEPFLTETAFGWGFYSGDSAMDGMAFKYIGWHLNPLLHKYFKQCGSFEYPCLRSHQKCLTSWMQSTFNRSRRLRFIVKSV